MTDKKTSDVLQALPHIRENPNYMKYYETENIPIYETSEYMTCVWFPGCLLIDSLTTLIAVLWLLWFYLITAILVRKSLLCQP